MTTFIILGLTEMWVSAAGTLQRYELDAWDHTETWPALAKTLEDSGFPNSPHLVFLLLYPLVKTRLFSWQVGVADAEDALELDHSRYFLPSDEAQTIRVHRQRRGRPLVAGAAPSALVVAIETACATASVPLRGIHPAAYCILEQLLGQTLALQSLEISTARSYEVLSIDDGAVSDVRYGLGQYNNDSRAQEDSPAVRVTLVGKSAQSSPAQASCVGLASVISELTSERLPFSFMTAERRSSERARIRNRRVRQNLISCSFVVCAFLLHLWSLQMRIQSIERQRGRLSSRVDSYRAITSKGDSLTRLSEAVQIYRSQSIGAARVLEAVSTILPDSTYLTHLGARGDTVDIEGLAPSTAHVLRGLERVAMVSDVQLVNPSTSGTDTLGERFRLHMRLAH